MKRVFNHIKRLFRKFWFLICIAFVISPIFCVGVLLMMTIISLLFFNDPIDVNAILEQFTEEELNVILSDELDESVSDEDYFELLARYQNFNCQLKLDKVTTWTGSKLTDTAYIYEYEINDEKSASDNIDFAVLKDSILSRMDTKKANNWRLIRTNRVVVFRYKYRLSGNVEDIIITTEELKG